MDGLRGFVRATGAAQGSCRPAAADCKSVMAESTQAAPPRTEPDRRLSVAPMMQRTDRHFRRFARHLTRRTLLYTEMIPLGAILSGARDRFLRFDPSEHPLALQVGGADPEGLAIAARAAEAHGYREINLNCGCPSTAVQHGGFGVVLMRVPRHVAECVRAMTEASALPVTIKTRIGLDDDRSDAFLDDFVGAAAEAGCRSFAIHARPAWLHGLSPKDNRTVPPLDHDRVRRLARIRPDLEIVINGGVTSLGEAAAFLAEGFGGAMIGRAAWDHPWLLSEADSVIFGERRRSLTREQVLSSHASYVTGGIAAGEPLRRLVKPLTGLYRQQPGARRWRQALSTARTFDDARAMMAG